MKPLRAVKGMNDVLPADIGRWHRLEQAFWEVVGRYGYGEVRTPVVEPTELFVRSIGEVTDIVEKEMYTFVDKGDQSLTLRPEGTASSARAYLQHAQGSKEAVSKWAYLGPMFRRERPARGRYRQFWQAGVELYGDPGPYCDAEIIEMVVGLLKQLGVQDLEVLINSLGGPETRARYRQSLLDFFSPKAAELSEESKRRLKTNPMRVLDSKAEADRALAAEAPLLIDALNDEDRAHFDELRRTLDALGTPYRVEPTLVRGLDYYTRTLFEIQGRGGELGAQNALCGGGRYDGLIESLGGPATPGIGFAMGLERILLALDDASPATGPEVFAVTPDPEMRIALTQLLHNLRRGGVRCDADLRGGSVKSQMRRASKANARLCIIFGSDEQKRGVVQVKAMAEGTQEEVPADQLLQHVVASRDPA